MSSCSCCKLLFCAVGFAGDFSSELLLDPDELLLDPDELLLDPDDEEESEKIEFCEKLERF